MPSLQTHRQLFYQFFVPTSHLTFSVEHDHRSLSRDADLPFSPRSSFSVWPRGSSLPMALDPYAVLEVPHPRRCPTLSEQPRQTRAGPFFMNWRSVCLSLIRQFLLRETHISRPSSHPQGRPPVTPPHRTPPQYTFTATIQVPSILFSKFNVESGDCFFFFRSIEYRIFSMGRRGAHQSLKALYRFVLHAENVKSFSLWIIDVQSPDIHTSTFFIRIHPKRNLGVSRTPP